MILKINFNKLISDLFVRDLKIRIEKSVEGGIVDEDSKRVIRDDR